MNPALKFAACLLAWTVGAAQAVPVLDLADWDIGLALDYTNGAARDLSSSKSWSASVLARYNTPDWQWGLDIPYLVVQQQAGDQPGNRSAGLGDIGLKVRRSLVTMSEAAPGLDLTFKLKTRTGDVAQGLGTGAVDAALQLDVFQRHQDLLFFGQLGKRRTGQSAGLLRASHPWYAELGVQKRLSDKAELGVYHFLRQANGRSGYLSETTVYQQLDLQNHVLQLSLTRGFSAASPRWGAGLAYTLQF